MWLAAVTETIFTGVENIGCYSCGKESTVCIRHADSGEREGRRVAGYHQAHERGFQVFGAGQEGHGCLSHV